MDDRSLNSLDEVVGHTALRADFRRMIAAGRLPHGICLHGPAGRGKRTLALALARHALVLDGAPPDRRQDPADLRVVAREEGVRQIGIEAVRDLREWFHLTPLEAPRRVAVIVEAERLTNEAGNALLKLLEEPPPGGLLLLTGRSRDAIMGTLVSRCLVSRVGPLRREELRRFLAARGAAGPSVELALALAEGSPGRALALVQEFDDAERIKLLTRLLAPRPEVFGEASAIASAWKEKGAKLEESREKLREALTAVSALLRLGLRAELGSQAAADSLARMPADLARAAAGRGGHSIEQALQACTEAREDLDSNLGVEVILQDLLPKLVPSAS